jgi:hypothetical protein
MPTTTRTTSLPLRSVSASRTATLPRSRGRSGFSDRPWTTLRLPSRQVRSEMLPERSTRTTRAGLTTRTRTLDLGGMETRTRSEARLLPPSTTTRHTLMMDIRAPLAPTAMSLRSRGWLETDRPRMRVSLRVQTSSSPSLCTPVSNDKALTLVSLLCRQIARQTRGAQDPFFSSSSRASFADDGSDLVAPNRPFTMHSRCVASSFGRCRSVPDVLPTLHPQDEFGLKHLLHRRRARIFVAPQQGDGDVHRRQRRGRSQFRPAAQVRALF